MSQAALIASERQFDLRQWLAEYGLAVSVSLLLHVLIVVLVAWGWESAPVSKHKVTPRFIEAKLVTVEAKTQKPKAAPKKNKVIDLTAKRREQQRREEAARKKRLAKEKAERERLRKLAEEKKRKQEALKKKQEQERLEKERQELEKQRRLQEQREQQRIAQEAAMADELAREEEMLLAEQDAATAQSYVAKMAQLIEQNWSRPPSARRGMKCELQLQLVPTGQVVSVVVTKSSGNPAFDRSAEQAVKKIGRFELLKEMPPSVFETYFRQLTLIFNPQDLRL
ncbi:cell envelope integrity protein TolA [Pseudomaricurvus alkylphenolicus]|uniref:cell envelope integrity protein TolA n=1 Tax=Pseudomaricurvus alkylphenolicus TaxID=1306991 RepID=UPI001420B7ED|nr:cell envelope integrity protein TolA [Pseudomaricurvus alkylphenolicus]NIB42003.1 cell envelope integrity protein TolA [Pseudomaricurvus alkylphenolicus]